MTRHYTYIYINRYSGRTSVVATLACLFITLAALTACQTSDIEPTPDPENAKTISAKLTFSLPQRIIGKPAETRMTAEVVQKDQDAASFRGIKDVRLFCFDSYPTATSTKIGKIIEVNALGNDAIDASSVTDYSVNKDIDIPVGTTHFGFYGRAADEPTTHDERMHYGTLETIGLSRSAYTGNSSIRFRPVPICTSTEPMGGSSHGQALLSLLNDLMSTVGPEAAPENMWSTATNLIMQETFKVMTELHTSSSFNVQTLLGKIYPMLKRVSATQPGHELAALLTQKIEDSCASIDAAHDKLELKDQFQGYPQDLHLPSGAARIVWNSTENRYEEPNVQAYGKTFDIPSVNDYCYPANLQYHVFSDLVVADTLVLIDSKTAYEQAAGNTDPTQQGDPTEKKQYEGWNQLIDSLYNGAPTTVDDMTRSVAMVEQVQYAVGQLALRAKIESGTLYDAFGKAVDVTNGFTIKGYIIGGQTEADYNYMPIDGSHEYIIYDTDINEGPQTIMRSVWTSYNYILGLATKSNEPVYMAMELVNNGPDFQGADGVIVHGSTFYLVANMVPSDGDNYTIGFLDQIFRKDFITQVNLKILNGWPDKNGDGVPDPDLDGEGHPKPLNGLATATYGLPNIKEPNPTVGLSVNLSWGEGLDFGEVPL